MACPHLNFAAQVNVHRLTDVDGGPVTSYLCEVEVRCHDCGMPFKFITPDVGVVPDRAATNVNGQQLNVYVEPSDGSLVESVRPGYRVTLQDGSKPSAN